MKNLEKSMSSNRVDVTEGFLVGPGCPPRTTTPPGTVGRGSVGDAGSGDTSLVGDGAGDSTSSTIEVNGLKIDSSALARVLRGKLREVVDKAFDGLRKRRT